MHVITVKPVLGGYIKRSPCIKHSGFKVPKFPSPPPPVTIIFTSIERSWSLFTKSQRPALSEFFFQYTKEKILTIEEQWYSSELRSKHFISLKIQESLIECTRQQNLELKFCQELTAAVTQKASSLGGKFW